MGTKVMVVMTLLKLKVQLIKEKFTWTSKADGSAPAVLVSRNTNYTCGIDSGIP
jgi:hypothetical protein